MIASQSLYSNIPNEEGLECFRDELNKQKEKSVPTNYIVTLLRLVLVWNIFEFDTKLFLQLMSTVMSMRAAPTFTNISMTKIDKWVLTASNSFAHLLKRLIVDIFMLWSGLDHQFLGFMEQIHSIHPTIKFTHSYNLEDKSTSFLGTTLKIINGKVVTYLYRKETNKV
jgi:hypothetical protein